MIKFDVLNRYTGKVQFTAEIDCKESECRSWKLRLAVERGIKNKANLREADLQEANLWKANLWKAKNICSFGPVGDEGRIGLAVNHSEHVMVQLGCFWATEAEAIKAIKNKYGSGSTYAGLVRAACKVLKETPK